MRRPGRVLVVALSLILLGGLMAWRTHTAGGTVTVRDVRWVTPSGNAMSALLYVPQGVSRENPAPGILAMHGYINSRETQSGFAIEFARRGYVVLSADQTGHGFSEPPAFGGGFGGPAALQYLRSLDFVDRDNIGLEGHSMGGWAVGSAAALMPDDYRSMVLVGSSTGTLGVPQGTPEWPRNLAVIWGVWDEFSGTMWNTAVPSTVGQTPKMAALFGTEHAIKPASVYGSVRDGTARVLYHPRTNHPGEHLSTEAIGNAVEWFQSTLDGGSDLPPSDQIWFWKEIGTLIATAGMVLLLFPLGVMMLRTSVFVELRRDPAPVRPSARWEWGVAAAFTALLGPLTLFRFKDLPGTLGWSPGPLFPQSITNSVIAWTTALAIITVALLGAWHLMGRRRIEGRAGDAYGLTLDGKLGARHLGKSLLLAALLVLAAYATLAVSHYFFRTDFRFWVFAIKPMSTLHLRMALIYFIPFTVYFLVLSIVLHAQLRRDDWPLRRAMLVNAGLLVIGYIGLYAYQYVPLLTGGTLSVASEPLWTIISYQLLPIMAIVAPLMTFYNRLTGAVYVSAFLAGMLVAWIVVASQATHVVVG